MSIDNFSHPIEGCGNSLKLHINSDLGTFYERTNQMIVSQEPNFAIFASVKVIDENSPITATQAERR